MKKIVILMLSIALLTAMLPMSVFAASQAEYTIDVRNRTGAPVEMSYRGADGITHFVTLPEGVSSLTLDEGIYAYWASPSCGNIAGTFNLSQQREILWITCDNAVPGLKVDVPVKPAKVGFVVGSCASAGGEDYGLVGLYKGGPTTTFLTEVNWQGPDTWADVWYNFVYLAEQAGSEPAYCATYYQGITDLYSFGYTFEQHAP